MSKTLAYKKPSILTVDASEILEYLGPVQGLASGAGGGGGMIGSVENITGGALVPMSDPTGAGRR